MNPPEDDVDDVLLELVELLLVDVLLVDELDELLDELLEELLLEEELLELDVPLSQTSPVTSGVSALPPFVTP